MDILFHGLAVAVILMFAFWLIYLVTNTPSVVDLGWSASLGIIAIVYFAQTGVLGLRRWVVLGAVLLWSIRLSTLLLWRFYQGQEDSRYVTLKQSWSRLKFLALFLAQGVAAAALSLPFAFAMTSNAPFGMWDLLGLFFFLIGMGGVSLSDHTMRRFRDNPANKGKVCKDGLWLYSRHPNYFFEIAIWVGFALLGLSAPWGFLGLISPALILYSLLYVTGIPPAEKELLASKGEAYRDYMNSTSPLIPLPPK